MTTVEQADNASIYRRARTAQEGQTSKGAERPGSWPYPFVNAEEAANRMVLGELL